ncbi:putative acyl-CoA synthetase YngI [Candidatus Sulfopaludibacter sp. SbA3]|nr:putative acyl-CoA synthetase YngI [Candidatus Sulfopaludibacter sp. SbA3]
MLAHGVTLGLSVDSLSYLRGAEMPLLEKTISQALADTAAKYPDRDALIVCDQHVRLTWRELDDAATGAARGLAGLGLQPGDRAGIWASNCVEWVLLQYAAARAGVVLVNVNPAYRSHELRYVLQRSHMRALFLRARDTRADYRAILGESRNGDKLPLEHVVWLPADDKKRSSVPVDHETDWQEILANGGDFRAGSAGPHDVANIQYTSGTTGSPKGVMLSHHNLLNNGMVMGQGLNATERDRVCAPVPLYHCFGSVIGSMVSVVYGAALILPSAQFDALATLEAVHRERATALYGVPTMFIAELGHPEFARFDLTSLRTGVMAGAPCPIEIMKQVVERMHIPELTIIYGQTESSPGITMSRANDPLELRVTTVGTVLPNTEVQIIDPETRARVPIGQQGELCTRGYLVMKGYDADPAATAEAVDADGWLHTGDLAVLRPDGYFSFRGRAKDTIIRGGENIYPREVEDFLHTHPKIADVYVIGIPDAKLGETVAAWVQLRPGEEATEAEIRDFCRGKIAYFKVPQFVRFVDGFPQTVTKKIQKFLMRDFEIKERGLEKVAGQATA